MKFGICTGLENLELLKELGYDYIEPQASKLAEYTEEEKKMWKEKLEAAGISCETFNVLLPADARCIGEEYEEAAFQAYLHKVFAGVKELGGEIVVFGSGKQRSFPESVSFSEAVRQLVKVYRLTGEIAAVYGLTVVIEPLNRSETNMICTMAEGAMLEAMVQHPNVKLLADYYHVAKDADHIEDLVRIGHLEHVHIATKEGRRYPTSKDSDDFAAFFQALKQIDYAGRVSIEGGTEQLREDGAKALQVLRELAAEAGF
ncbi:MAG: sugar phosphate isomerase/epimerase family protein [bacterium]|nr:sugar phosphate isomerase/epimerase family protein [bacterium]